MRETNKQRDFHAQKRSDKTAQGERKPEESAINGIRIKKLNLEMMIGSLLVFLLVFFATIEVSKKTKELMNAIDDYIACEKDAEQVNEASSYLTEQVRMYVVTRESKYRDNYFTELDVNKSREKAITELEGNDVSSEAKEYLKKAVEYSNTLSETEIYAMKLLAVTQKEKEEDIPEEVRVIELTEDDQALSDEDKIQKAQDLVFNDDYEVLKAEIESNITSFTSLIVGETKAKEETSRKNLKYMVIRQRVYVTILFIFNVLTFLLINVLIVKPLQIYVRCLKEQKRLEIMGAYEFRYLALTYNDIYDLNEANRAMLQHKVEHDTLTGVLNRTAFEHLKQVLKVKTIPIALLIVDVDNFKMINDSFGHEVGDKVLIEVARTLENSFRGNDYVARIGGDEFCVILVECSIHVASVINKKVDKINEHLRRGENGLPCVSLSIGMGFSERGFSDDLFQKADEALYEVKEHGRCGFCFYDPNGEF